MHATFWLEIEESSPRFAWLTHERLGSRFMAPDSGACVTGIS